MQFAVQLSLNIPGCHVHIRHTFMNYLNYGENIVHPTYCSLVPVQEVLYSHKALWEGIIVQGVIYGDKAASH